MKRLLLLITLLFAQYSDCQNLPMIQNESKNVLEEKVRTLENQVSRLQDEVIAARAESKNADDALKVEVNKNIDNYKSDTKDLLNLYIFFISIGVIIIGFAINWFGKSAIKARVEELITETIKQHAEQKIVETLNSKITNELIEATIKTKSEDEINKIIESIKQDGNSVIETLKSKGDEAIKSMLAAPPKLHLKIQNKNLSDSEIVKQKDTLRADEFFNIAYNSSQDPRIKIELYKNVLEIEPNNFQALNNMAVSYLNLNETEKAIDALSKAIELHPNYVQAYANRAKAYNLQDVYDKSLADAEKAIEIDPRFEYSYTVKGNVLTKQGKFEDAEISLNTAIQINPNSAEAYYNRAYFYEERFEFDKSKRDYKTAEELGFENKAMLYNNMAVLYRRLKDFDKAIDLLDKAREFNPSFPNIDGTLALIYADKKDDDNFFKYLTMALEKGCPVWNYLTDPGFDNYRESKRLSMLIEPFKKKYFT